MVWTWFATAMIPTVLLIAGVLVQSALQKGAQTRSVSKFVYRLALLVSLAYILLAFALPFLGVAAEQWGGLTRGELLVNSTGWLSPLQGVVTAVLGAFFTAKDRAE